MPIARAVQLSLPFDAIAPERATAPDLAPAPAVAWRTFGNSGPVRQWIAFPPLDREVANLTQHLQRCLLVQFTDAGVWLFRSDPRYRWPDSDLQRVAERCRRVLGNPCLNLKALHRELAESIDATFEVLLPELGAGAWGAWQVRALAVDEVMAQAARLTGRRNSRTSEGNLSLLAERLEARMSVELSQALEGFLAQLDPDAVRTASAGGMFSTQAFNLLTGPGAEAQRNRRQFADTFPLFAAALWLGNASPDYLVGLREAVDSGRPMVDFLAQAFHVQRHTIRCLIGQSAEELGRRFWTSPARLISLLDSLPPELRPAAGGAWRVIESMVAAAEDRALRPTSRPLLRIALQHWQRCTRNDEDPGGAALTEFTAQAEQVTEFWAMLEDCLRTRASTTHRGARSFSRRELRAMADGVLAERGWSSLVELARRWRNALARAQAAVQRDTERLLGQRFAPLLPEDLVVAGRVLVPLVTATELAQEGQALQHCIGTYASACAGGESYMVSVREAHSRRPLSTAQFELTRNRPGRILLRLRQHRARGNAEPAAECAAAVRHLLDHAAAPALQTHWARLLAEQQERAGYAPSAAKRIAAILAHEHAIREVLRPHGRYEQLLGQLLAAAEDPQE